MSPLWFKKNESFTIVVGCGRLGAGLANNLSDEGADVLVIDSDKNSFQRLSPSFSGLTLVGNATDLEVLEEADISRATSVIAVTNYDNTNILVAQMVKELYGTEHVIARLYESSRECVYQDFGIDTISPAALSIEQIGKLLKSTEAPDNNKG